MDSALDPTSDHQLSAWDLLGLPGSVPAATFLTSPLASQYRLIVDALADEQTVSLTGVGHGDLEGLIRKRLPSRRQPPYSAT